MGKQDDDLIEQVIISTFLSQQVFSKAMFDNAKDTNELLAAAQENANMLIIAVKSKLIRYREELTLHTLEDILKGDQGKLTIRRDNGETVVVDFRISTEAHRG